MRERKNSKENSQSNAPKNTLMASLQFKKSVCTPHTVFFFCFHFSPLMLNYNANGWWLCILICCVSFFRLFCFLLFFFLTIFFSVVSSFRFIKITFYRLAYSPINSIIFRKRKQQKREKRSTHTHKKNHIVQMVAAGRNVWLISKINTHLE